MVLVPPVPELEKLLVPKRHSQFSQAGEMIMHLVCMCVAGILPRASRETIHCPRAHHILGCMETCKSIYRQSHKGKGKTDLHYNCTY
jgi:hypothetical protein